VKEGVEPREMPELRQLRRAYFFNRAGRIAASDTVSSVRPSSSAITKASGIF